MSKPGSSRALQGLVLATVIALVARYSARFLPAPPWAFFPRSFVVHSVMLALTLAGAWWFSRGRLREFGLTRGEFRLNPRILLWILPTWLLSLPGAILAAGSASRGGLAGLTGFQTLVFVCVYASISEEFLTRGLLQTLLSQGIPGKSNPTRMLSIPIVVSACFFGAMHLVLVPSLGLSAIPVIVLAVILGLVAGWYRETTGSLAPAVIVHALFDLGGILPFWVVGWIRS